MPDKFTLLDDRCVIAVSGDDAKGFLQGLVTAQLEGLAAGDAVHAGMLTPQGKILFDFFIVAGDDGFLIDVGVDQRDKLVQRLMMYKLRASVDIAVKAELSIGAGWPGGRIDGFYDDPRLAAMGWRVIGKQKKENATLADYHGHRIALGIPDTSDIGSGLTFPHEANFDQLGSVSFNKGCYVGQEVVSRMQHKAVVRSRIVPVKFDKVPGENEIRSGGKKIGQMLSVVATKGLAMIRLDRAQKAIDNGDAILAGDVEITIVKPDWAEFEIPE